MGNFKDLSLLDGSKPVHYFVAENCLVLSIKEDGVILNKKVIAQMQKSREKGCLIVVVSSVEDSIFQEVLKIHEKLDLIPDGYNNVNPFTFDLSNPDSLVIGSQFYNCSQLGDKEELFVPFVKIESIEEAMLEIKNLQDTIKKLNEQIEELKKPKDEMVVTSLI